MKLPSGSIFEKNEKEKKKKKRTKLLYAALIKYIFQKIARVAKNMKMKTSFLSSRHCVRITLFCHSYEALTKCLILVSFDRFRRESSGI